MTATRARPAICAFLLRGPRVLLAQGKEAPAPQEKGRKPTSSPFASLAHPAQRGWQSTAEWGITQALVSFVCPTVLQAQLMYHALSICVKPHLQVLSIARHATLHAALCCQDQPPSRRAQRIMMKRWVLCRAAAPCEHPPLICQIWMQPAARASPPA